ncbi:HAD family hydrolase [Tardiphaga sp. 42S5]|uniref:HAD family hydrolase n=1 Tax=Tardiphaga sp. 42S5 TaxID=1404799 RepID=UPI002A5A5880|nr:HAD family hydrolase [Tardiphaga sp. 42S5]WPO44432.1 HAD family hydrolase [Tardiphaga sp. 42S5]
MDTVFFDLDGTLTDPKIGITGSIQYALEKLGIPVPTQDELTWCIGPPLRASFVALLGGEKDADRGVELYRERFGTIGLFENTLYPGIADTLTAVTAPGRRLFVATSKPHVFADRIIDHFGLRKYFTRVFGSELDGTRVDKSDLLRYALDETSTDPARAIMIGDRKHDIIGAANNGIPAIGVLYGYGGREELTSAGARHLVASPAEIPGYID